MVILTDEIAMTADRKQYTIGKPCNGRLISKQYFTRFENALQEAVRIAVRLEIANGRIAELRQIVAEQARFEPVSYTHLDVYKRQVPMSITSSPVLCIRAVKRRAVILEWLATKPTMRACICSK